MSSTRERLPAGTVRRCLIIAALAFLARSAWTQTWNAAADFSPSANPNGAWSYGWKQTLNSPFQPYIGTWSCGAVLGWASGAPPTLGKNTGTTAACCATWSAPAGTLHFHPGGSGERSVYRWTAPIAGSFAVTTDFAGIDYAYPTTTDVAVEINGVLVYSQSINSYSAGTACASNSYVPAAAFQGSYSLSAGDHVDVSVGWGSNGNYYGDATLVSIVIAGSNGASATPVGHGCGAGATVPVLACSPPVIGQSVTLSIANGTPSVGGTIFASPPPAGTIDLGGGCTAYLDVGGYFPLLDPIITNPSGAWLLSLAVPYDIGLVGFTLALQGALFGTSGPLGLDLTNGVIITVGS